MTHDEEIIQEATEIYEKNQNAGALVGDLLRIIKSQSAEIERLKKNLEEAHIDIREHMAEIEKKDTEIDILIRKKHSLRDEISELTAEVERLSDRNHKCIYLSDDETTEFCVDGACPEFETKAMIKTKAYREFADKCHTDIHQALESNYKAKK